MRVGIRRAGKIEIHTIDFDMEWDQAIAFVRSQIPKAKPILVEIIGMKGQPIEWSLPKEAA